MTEQTGIILEQDVDKQLETLLSQLSSQHRIFALEYAGGKSQSDAYLIAFPDNKEKSNSLYVNASKLAHSPIVQQIVQIEVERRKIRIAKKQSELHELAYRELEKIAEKEEIDETKRKACIDLMENYTTGNTSSTGKINIQINVNNNIDDLVEGYDKLK